MVFELRPGGSDKGVAVRAIMALDRFAGSEEAKAGFLATIPAKRAGSVEEVAETILFLASDKARYLTGQSLAVDGGYTAQ